MNSVKTSRRQFVQLAGGAALALRHGLLPAQSAVPPAQTKDTARAAAASFGDSSVYIEWDANFHTRVSRVAGANRTALTSWGPSDYLLLADGRRAAGPETEESQADSPLAEVPRTGRQHIARFALQQHRPPEAVDDANGPGTRVVLSGTSDEGIEKTVAVTLYRRYPGFAVFRVSYRNLSAAPVSLRGWTNGDFLVLESRSALAAGGAAPGFWCYSGASYEDRRDWVRPVKRGFAQDNFLGMEASDYGGGTPIVDVWRPDGGLAVGHVETSPKLVSLPVQEHEGRVRIAVCSRSKHRLDAGATFQTLDTFVAVHDRDHFATLNTYRQVMADRGLKPARAGASCYEPIWCAWGYERDCTTALIEGTLPKVKDLGLDWAVIDDGWQSNVGDWKPHPSKYPQGEEDVRGLVTAIRARGLKARLWYSPLSVAPGADLLHDHADMLLLDKEGAVQKISWWNSFYLCPAYEKTVAYTAALVTKFIGDWGFAGLKIDGQHLNGVPPCFNPAHHHARPEESVEGLQNFYQAI